MKNKIMVLIQKIILFNGNDERIKTDEEDNFSYFELLLKPETFENLARTYYSNKNDKLLFSNAFLEFAKKI